MEKEKPYCRIDVPNVETAAYLMAVMNPSVGEIYDNDAEDFIHLVSKTFQGKTRGLRAAHAKIFNVDIWHQLANVLKDTGCYYNEKSAPWCTPQAPTRRAGYPVTCRKAGLQIGPVEVTTEELKLLLEKCEEAEE